MKADSLKEAYQVGQKIRELYNGDYETAINMDDELYQDMRQWTHAYYMFCECGIREYDIPQKVKAWRYGKINGEMSYNYRDDRPEKGISVMQVKGGEKTNTLYEAINGGDIIYLTGYLLPWHGADGEPLLVACKEITQEEYNMGASPKGEIKKRRERMKFKFSIEIEVDQIWIDDGLTANGIKEELGYFIEERLIPYAVEGEIKATIK